MLKKQTDKFNGLIKELKKIKNNSSSIKYFSSNNLNLKTSNLKMILNNYPDNNIKDWVNKNITFKNDSARFIVFIDDLKGYNINYLKTPLYNSYQLELILYSNNVINVTFRSNN